jgi:hypothetical protein
MLYNMLCKMLCNMIRNVLHKMLRAKKPPPPLPGSGSALASLQCQFIQQLLGCFALIIRKGRATFRVGAIGGRGGAVRGARRRSAGFDRRDGPVVLGQIHGVPGQHFVLNVLHAGPCRLPKFVINFIQLLHGAGVPVQEVKPGIDHGILSLPEGRHSEEACQTDDHHLEHAWNLLQSNAPVAGPSCVMLCPSVPGESSHAA